MSVPAVLGLSHVKVPVTDLEVAREWYGRVLGFRTTREFADSGGVVRGVQGELPGAGEIIALREDAEAARGLGVFAVANLAVADRAGLEEWTAHLDAVGVEHGGILDVPGLSILVFSNPDGQEVHLYARAPRQGDSGASTTT